MRGDFGSANSVICRIRDWLILLEFYFLSFLRGLCCFDVVFTYGLRGATDTLALVVCRGLALVGELLLHGVLQHEARTCETGKKGTQGGLG